MNIESRPRQAYFIFGLGLLSASISSILVRYASEAPSIVVAAWRTIFAVVFLIPFLIPSRIAKIRALRLSESRLIVLAGIFLGLHFIVWIEAFYHTSVASATVLVSTTPIFLALLAFFVLREKLPMKVWIAIMVAVGGAAIIGFADPGTGQFPNATIGNALALSAALLVSLYLLVGRFLRRDLDWYTYVFPLFLVASITVLVGVGVSGQGLFGYSSKFYFICAMIALFPQIIGHGSFNYAVKYFPAAVIGIGGLIEPVIASVLAYFLFSEVPAKVSVLGMLLIIIAIVWVVQVLERRRKTYRPEL